MSECMPVIIVHQTMEPGTCIVPEIGGRTPNNEPPVYAYPVE